MHKFRITAGPLNLKQFESLLPKGKKITAFSSLINNYVGFEFKWDLNLVLEKKEVPALSKEEFVEKIKTDDKFAKEHGELPRIYGEQWRAWPAADGRKIDQLKWVVDTLKNFPERKPASRASSLKEGINSDH